MQACGMTRAGWIRETYPISTMGGGETRRAWRSGIFAVYWAGKGEWRVDHVPSGCGVAGWFESRENAMRACECVAGQVKGWTRREPSQRALRAGCAIFQTFRDFHPPVRVP